MSCLNNIKKYMVFFPGWDDSSNIGKVEMKKNHTPNYAQCLPQARLPTGIWIQGGDLQDGRQHVQVHEKS